MSKRWTAVALGLAVACALAVSASAGGEGEKQKQRGKGQRKERGAKRSVWMDQMLKRAGASVVTAAAELDGGKAALAQYKTEAGEAERELMTVRGKCMREIREAAQQDGQAAATQGLVEKAKAEMKPVMQKVVDARLRYAEALLNVAKQNPQAVADQMVENQFMFVAKMRRARQGGGAGRERRGRRDKEGRGAAGGNVIE